LPVEEGIDRFVAKGEKFAGPLKFAVDIPRRLLEALI
jgi:hypothetical protein